MSQETDHIHRPDPQATLRQAAGLAEHLGRIGAQWLPQPDPEAVKTLVEQFQSDAAETPAAPAVAESPAPAANPPAANPPAPQTPAPQRPAAPPQSPTSAQAPTIQAPATKGSAFSLVAESPTAGHSYPGPAASSEQRTAALAEYAQQVAACTRCDVLSKCRTQTVFGEGNVNPRVVFFGEAPGRDEDLSGRPFVGKAGELLTKMIQACKFAREDVYILNTVKCRPPNNRNPEPTEIDNCREFFEAQLNLLRPEYIVCLGLISTQALLRTKLSVGQLRGKLHNHFDSKVVVTYHPAYLLRNPAAKKAAWDDLQLMLRDAGLM